MTCTCPSCGGAINYTDADAGGIEACPHCSARLTLPSSSVNIMRRQQVRRGGALWWLAKAVGLLIAIASFVWLLLLLSTILMTNAKPNAWAVAAFASLPALFGMLVGVALFAFARRRGVGFVCSNCGQPLRKNSAVCVGCGAVISE
jgi:hypothetical protein